MGKRIVLLRGINVGAHNRIKMADLRSCLENAGFGDVTTLLQTGNILLESDLDATEIAAAVESVIESDFGFTPRAIVRSPEEVGRVLDDHPFSPDHLSEPRFAHVLFCASEPSGEGFERIQESHEGNEELWLGVGEVFVYYTDGSGRSKLTNSVLEKVLGTQTTSRNWNTVLKIAERMD